MRTAVSPRGRGRLALVGMGASLGQREASLALAVRLLDSSPGVTVEAVSEVFRTPPMGSAARAPFLNAAVRLRTERSPRGLLGLCKAIEARVGRRPARRWADRRLDLDILIYEGLVRRGRDLVLPHPGLDVRAFAWVPAVQVGGDVIHPVRGRRLSALEGPPARGLVSTRLTLGGRTGPRVARAHGQGYTGLRPARASGSGRALSRHPLPRVPTTRSSLPMKFFIDTANLDEIREAHSWGILDGVTTNPSLVAREGGDFVERIAQICEIVKGPVSAETVSQEAAGMIREGRLLAKVSEHVVVKVPLTTEGLKATRVLSDEGIDVNVTLCFQPMQALIAAKAGAAYISPFLGRLDDISTNGVQLIDEIVAIYNNYPELGTEVLAASIRHPLHLTQVALAGADVATVPMKVLQQLVKHPLTESGNERFLADWDTVPDNDIAGQVTRWLEKRGR